MKLQRTLQSVDLPGLENGWLPLAGNRMTLLSYLVFCFIITAAPLVQGLYYEIEFMPALFLLGLALGMSLLGKVQYFVNGIQPLDWAMAGLVTAYLFSLLTAVHQHQAVLGLLQVCAYFMVYCLAARIGNDKNGFQGLMAAAYLAAMLMALAGLASALGWVDWPGFYTEGMICSTLQYHNALAIYLVAASIIGAAWILQTEFLFSRLLLAGGNYILLLVLIGTLSRGAWLLYPLGLAALLYLLNRGDRLKYLVYTLWNIIIALSAGRFFFAQIGHSSGLAVLILLAGLALSCLIPGLMLRLPSFNIPFNENRLKLIIIGLSASVIFLLVMLFVHYHSQLSGILPQNAVDRAGQASGGSVQERLVSYQDALKIMKDYPLIGAGGGGWAALYQQYAGRSYYVKELHNYYLKVAVEAGMLGLGMLMAAAVLFFRLLFQARSRKNEQPPAVFWGAVTAFLLIALHAAIDFDLSLPGIALLFFALLGAVRAWAGHEPPPDLPGRGRKRKRQTMRQVPASRVDRILPIALWGLTLLSLLSASGWLLAWFSGQSAYDSLAANRLEEAHSNYRRAVLLSPFNARYLGGLAMTEARIAGGDKEKAVYNEAVEQARMAARFEPYGIENRLNLFKVYGLLHLPQQQLMECHALIKAVPLEPHGYKLASVFLMNGAWNFIMKSDMESAGGYLLQLLDIRASMPAKIREIPPEVNLAAGQAALLAGHHGEARTYLQAAVHGKKTQATAQYWLGILEKQGQVTGNQGTIAELDPATLRDLLEHR